MTTIITETIKKWFNSKTEKRMPYEHFDKLRSIAEVHIPGYMATEKNEHEAYHVVG